MKPDTDTLGSRLCGPGGHANHLGGGYKKWLNGLETKQDSVFVFDKFNEICIVFEVSY